LPAPQAERCGVIVSAGGGAVGEALLAAAVAAKPLTRLRHEEWLVVSGPLSQPRSQGGSGIRFVRALPDLPGHLARSVLSISQAGYNTMTETLAAQTPCVAVPFETDREREQIMRAQRLATFDLVSVVRSCDLTPESLAQAVDDRIDRGMAAHGLNLDGVAGTVAAIRALMGGA
jgi:predicted glycosyltransferase